KRSPIRSTRPASMRSISPLPLPCCRSPLPCVVPWGNSSNRSFGDNRIGFNLDQPLRSDEGGDLKHAVGRANVGEELTMHTAHGLPMGYVDEIDARPHHVVEAPPEIS